MNAITSPINVINLFFSSMLVRATHGQRFKERKRQTKSLSKYDEHLHGFMLETWEVHQIQTNTKTPQSNQEKSLEHFHRHIFCKYDNSFVVFLFLSASLFIKLGEDANRKIRTIG